MRLMTATSHVTMFNVHGFTYINVNRSSLLSYLFFTSFNFVHRLMDINLIIIIALT